MRRWLYAHRLVAGDPEVLEARLRRGLHAMLGQATAEPDGALAGDGSFRVRLEGPSVAGTAVAKAVRVTTGVATWSRDGRLRIPCAWRAEPVGPAFPTFEGNIEFEPLSSRDAQVSLVGTYRLPLGPVGAALDVALLGGVAEATAQRLVDALADALGRRHPSAGPQPRPVSAPLHVADVMTSDPIVFTEGMPLRTAALVLFHHRISGAPVLTEHGALVGVLSEADLLHKGAGKPSDRLGDARRRSRATTVGEACSRPARTTTPRVPLRSAAAELLSHDIARLVVIDGATVAGMVTRHDVLRALLRTDDELQAAVDDLLERLDEPQVEATVEWGEVRLDGRVRLRSYLFAVVDAVEAIDGVMAVRSELAWAEDDMPALLPLHPSI